MNVVVAPLYHMKCYQIVKDRYVTIQWPNKYDSMYIKYIYFWYCRVSIHLVSALIHHIDSGQNNRNYLLITPA